MLKQITTGLVIISSAFIASQAFAAPTAQTTLSANVVGTAAIDNLSTTLSFGSNIQNSDINAGNVPDQTDSAVEVYADTSNPNGGYTLTVNSSVMNAGQPALGDGNGSFIPLTISGNSCGASPDAFTFDTFDGSGNASTTVTGANAQSSACAASKAKLNYHLGTPGTPVNGGNFQTVLTYTLQAI